MLISIEGIDGAGKSSHISRLKALIESLGKRVVVSREPGGTPLAEVIRQQILSSPMDGVTEAMLFFAGRRDHIQNLILPSLRSGTTVISDRFTDSSFAYQGGGRGFNLATLVALEEIACEGLQPDLTLLFDIDPVEAARRRQAGRPGEDRIEKEGIEFFTRVRNGYLERAKASPGRFRIIDASKPVENVWEQVGTAYRSHAKAMALKSLSAPAAPSPAEVESTTRARRITALKNELDALLEVEAQSNFSKLEDLKTQCVQLANNGRLIEACKLYRTKTGLSLIESKFAVEGLVEKSERRSMAQR